MQAALGVPVFQGKPVTERSGLHLAPTLCTHMTQAVHVSQLPLSSVQPKEKTKQGMK